MKKAVAFRNKMAKGELIIGGHAFLTDPAISEILAFHGYDFVWIDAEHSPYSNADILRHIVALDAAGAASLVRVPWNDAVLIKPVLEMGPDGIIAPMVNTAREAADFVRACTYPPEGIRGYGPRRASRYGAVPPEEYIKCSSEWLLKIVQIEHIKAVDSLEAICDVAGVDLLIVGPKDLSGSLGILGETRDSLIMPVYDRIAEICLKKKMPFGVSLAPNDEESIKEWIGRGISVLSCGDDISFLAMGARGTISHIKAIT